MPLIIGLTGGIASGKTTVADLFQQHFNIDIVDADVVAREVVALGSVGLSKIVDHFGSAITLEDGQLDRAKLREHIFSNPQEKAWLDQLLHPMIREKILSELYKTTSPYALLVVPLMIENNLQVLTDRLLVIDVSPDIQIQRTMDRDNVSEKQVRAILQSQASREERLLQADDIVENNTLNQPLLPKITELHQKYLAIARGNLGK
ncbi:dephospho-CoA kinase [Vibrio sp. 10N.286.49.B3]|uniref:dephospho-CoA kinase n=1 Tax=Vibrio sp. 10N.286.49.B3 TaxID=1880855 RepID=UPI000C84758B|nr:dephospho-CoA kinase [Vibrio sp. 10N.286.49.B3]PMH41268.1 dephospho-CoA kinase [Vibrio sp. 10N.286.49.B3]